MLIAPLNDRGCLAQLVERAQERAATATAKTLAAQLGSVRALVQWLQALPQTNDSGTYSPEAVRCDLWQRLRDWPPDPNCFERTAMFLAIADNIAPAGRFTAATFELPSGGRHTAPVSVSVQGEPFIFELSPRPGAQRNAEWWQEVAGGVHTVGKVVLSAYGLGGVADQLGGLEREWGLLPPDATKAGPSTTTPSARPSPPPQSRQPQPQPPTAERKVQPWPPDPNSSSSPPPARPSPTPSPAPVPSTSSERWPDESSEASPSPPSRRSLGLF